MLARRAALACTNETTSCSRTRPRPPRSCPPVRSDRRTNPLGSRRRRRARDAASPHRTQSPSHGRSGSTNGPLAAGWLRNSFHSSSLGRPGLLSTSARTSILPASCTRADQCNFSRSATDKSELFADQIGVHAHTLRVAAGDAIVPADGGDQRQQILGCVRRRTTEVSPERSFSLSWCAVPDRNAIAIARRCLVGEHECESIERGEGQANGAHRDPRK